MFCNFVGSFDTVNRNKSLNPSETEIFSWENNQVIKKQEFNEEHISVTFYALNVQHF